MVGLAKMQQNSIPLLFQMFNAYYGPFSNFSESNKVI
jgi:hypothetical protein